MMSPGRGWNDRLREQSDSEDERNAPNLPSGFEDFTPASVANNTAAISSGGIRRNSASTAAATATAAAAATAPAAAARDSHHHHHRGSSSFFARHAAQDLPAIDLAPDSAAPQHNTTSVPPVARPAGNKRRMSLHVRKSSKAEAAQLAADEIKREAEERRMLEQVAPIRGLAKQMSRMDIRRKPSILGQPHHRSPDSGSDLPGIGSWLSGHSRRQSRADAPAAAAAAAAAAATATAAAVTTTTTTTTTGFVVPPVPPEPLVSENPGRMEAGYRPGHNESVHGRGAEGAGNPDTPPPLRNVQRRTSLLHQEPTEEAPAEELDQELMIGEIRSIHLDVEIALARKALVIIALSYVAAYALRTFAGRLSKEVNVLLIVCFVSTLLLSFPFIRFTARLFAYVITTWAPGLLYRGNRYYFVVALHYDIAIVIWSILSVIVWHQLFFSWVYPKESYSARVVFDYGDPILQCHLALRVGILVKNFLVLLVATSYLWRPYLQRVQSSILAQYILLLLTDYSIKGACNPDDQNFALEMVRQGSQNKKNISLYAVSKAMGFIPRHKLEHSFFRHLAGSDTLDSSKDATIIGNYLFEKLILRSKPKLSPIVTATPRRSLGLTSLTTNSGGGLGGFRKQSASFMTRRQSSSRKFSRPGLHKRHSEPNTATRPAMSSATSLDSDDDRFATVGGGGEGGNHGGGGGRGRGSRIRSRSVGHTSNGSSSSGSGDEDGSSVPIMNLVSNKVASGFSKLLTAGERAFASNTSGGAGGGGSSSSGGVSSRESSTGPVPADSDKGVDESAAAAAGDETKEEHSAKGDAQVTSIPEEDEDDAREASVEDAGGKDKDGVKEVVKAAPEVRRASTAEEEEEETEPEEVLVRATLCPLLHEELIKIAFKLFDADTSGTVTREEMVMGVVRTFKDHRSLARTLQDSEHIARKLGLIIMGVILFILMFVWLSIWGADVVSLSVTFASFLIAFSFMIGAAASNLVSSVLFIFVSRIYDVGDRVHIYDGALGTTPTDVTVAKVDLMTTVFKRWDEQVFYMPNHLLATKTIVNIQRTAHQWHEFFIQVSSSTPSDKLKALQASLQSFCKKKDKPDGLYSRMSFTLTAVENSNKLVIRITFRQRGNWQQMEKKWACQSMCAWAIKNACGSLGIKYTMPEVPLTVKKEKTV